jgi:hypothetical protein
MQPLLDVTVADGKYRIVQQDSTSDAEAFRYGEGWIQNLITTPGANMLLAMARELEELRGPIPLKFAMGAAVQRSGDNPAYRFPGFVCGFYRSGTGAVGYAVAHRDEPGLIHIFSERMLEERVDG